MAGFTLPKLRWLVAGAAAAAVWAMNQEPPPRRHATQESRPAATPTAAPAPVARPHAATPKAVEPQRPKPKQVEAAESEPKLADVATPQPRPSPLVTSSIPRPKNPVGPAGETERRKAVAEARPGKTLFVSARVRMRKGAGLDAKVITWLKQGQAALILGRKGEWLRVSVDGEKGWVHGDYLTTRTKAQAVARKQEPDHPPRKVRQKPERSVSDAIASAEAGLIPAKRPSENISRPVASASGPGMSFSAGGGAAWTSLRPIREPQGGDCQCPYDLMLSGKQCGSHSAYARTGGKGAACYD